jgi:hypothetical protein
MTDRKDVASKKKRGDLRVEHEYCKDDCPRLTGMFRICSINVNFLLTGTMQGVCQRLLAPKK